MHTPIVNLDQLEPQAMPPEYAAAGAAAGRYAPHIVLIGSRIGARQIGCNLTVLAPARKARTRSSTAATASCAISR